MTERGAPCGGLWLVETDFGVDLGHQLVRRALDAEPGVDLRHSGLDGGAKHLAALLFERLALIFPRRRGQRDYAATAPVWDLNSNSIGLT